MTVQRRDRIFISYSRKDQDIFAEVKQQLLDRELGGRLCDDTDIRLSERWDARIQDMLDQTAVAVLILSENYFRRLPAGEAYILEKELPYLLEHYQQGELDLLLLYWNPSPYFAPDNPDTVELFKYQWENRTRSYDLHEIQAEARHARLAAANAHDRLDAFQRIALEAKRRIAERTPDEAVEGLSGAAGGRLVLTVVLSITGSQVNRVFRVAGQVVPAKLPGVPRGLHADLQSGVQAGVASASPDRQLGGWLYQLLFGPADQDGFPQLAQSAWGLEPGGQASTLGVAVNIRCDPMADDPWPLPLPWNLTAFRGEALAERCGWSFEVTPPGESARLAQILSPEPPLLFLFDPQAAGAQVHAGRLSQYLDQVYGFAAEAIACDDVAHLEAQLHRVPQPEILYVFGTTRLVLDEIASTLNTAVALVVLNLIGENPVEVPQALVHNRKLILSVTAAANAERAAEQGHSWLRTFLEQGARASYSRSAIEAFGPEVRLWSGCARLETEIAKASSALFRRPLIKLLLDRLSARQKVSDEVATALREGWGVLGLVAAGTADDHPELLPQQVWHHYAYVRDAASRDAIVRREIAAGDYPTADDMLYRLARQLGSGTDDWEYAVDRLVGELQPGERAVVSLEWRIPDRPDDQEAAKWRTDWLNAWWDMGTEPLAGYRKPGVLIVHILLVEEAAAEDAQAWCREAQALNRERRRRLTEPGRRFVYQHLTPLSEVPVEDIERFLDVHYRLPDYYSELDPFAVASRSPSETLLSHSVGASGITARHWARVTGTQAMRYGESRTAWAGCSCCSQSRASFSFHPLAISLISASLAGAEPMRKLPPRIETMSSRGGGGIDSDLSAGDPRSCVTFSWGSHSKGSARKASSRPAAKTAAQDAAAAGRGRSRVTQKPSAPKVRPATHGTSAQGSGCGIASQSLVSRSRSWNGRRRVSIGLAGRIRTGVSNAADDIRFAVLCALQTNELL